LLEIPKRRLIHDLIRFNINRLNCQVQFSAAGWHLFCSPQ
jgi:hypothetical protein